MSMETIRVGIVGLGANTRNRHVPGLRGCDGVEIVGVCNRTPESTKAAAAEFHIPKTYDRWQELTADPDVDAVVIGTWPYLHCEVTLAALEHGKHVLTEARMASSAAEARTMALAAERRPDLVTQIVPSPVGLVVDATVRRLTATGFLGELREFVVLGTTDAYASFDAPLHWRQSRRFSGCNMLTLGIMHETVTRWIAEPVRVFAQGQTFTPSRVDTATGRPGPVEVPDCVHVLTELPQGARGLYHLSGVAMHGPGFQVHLYGSEGTLKILTAPEETLWGARRGETELRPIPIPPDEAGGWRVEAEFVAAIRGEERVRFTDFSAGLRYMEFTEAVTRSLASGGRVSVGQA